MRLTIRISTGDLKKLEESGGFFGGLTFNVEETYQSSNRLRGLNVAPEVGYFDDVKKRLGVAKKREEQQRQLEASEVSDFYIEIKQVNQIKYQVLKIEPDEEHKI